MPVLFVVAANGEYRTLKDTLDEGGSRSTALGSYTGLDLAPPAPHWPSAARLFGIPALRVADPGELRDAVASAARLDGPLLIEVPVTGHGDRR